MDKPETKEALKAVSYTHLDVYKRQDYTESVYCIAYSTAQKGRLR